LSGTLGSGAEQDMLSSAYDIKFAKIPLYKKKKFKELDMLCVRNSHLSAKVVVESISQCELGRAVLIICETIKDLDKIAEDFKLFKQIFPDVQFEVNTFRDEDESKITQKKLQPCDIIISTNIAGRGTDFKTVPQVETNGGLHVILTFCPTNQRVEDQAFGRTARQGNSGTAQIILIYDEIFNNLGGNKIIKELRDKNEIARINDIKNFKLAEIDYNDKIFGYFSEVYVELYLKHKNQPVFPYFLRDLKEFWAFWFEKKNNGKGKNPSEAEADFNQFKSEANEIINGKIRHNPYYLVKQAKILIDHDELDQAVEVLNEAINIGNSSEILYSAYFSLFEVSILKGNQLTERFVKALSNTLFIPYKKDDDYKHKAKENLNKAESALKIEIDIIKSLKDLSWILVGEKKNNIEQKDSLTDKESNFIPNHVKTVPKSPETEDNILTKHLLSRLACLETYLENLQSLKKQLESSDGLIIDKKIPNFLASLGKEELEKKKILNAEINEIDSVGLNDFYSVKKVYDVPTIVLNRAIAQILGGVAALAIGLAFPPALVCLAPIAGCLISEGVSDIVLELISQGEDEYSEKEYVKSKITSYGISIATMGLSAIASSIKILNKASKVCQAMSAAFQRSPFLKTIFNKVADKVAKLGQYFNRLKLEKISQNMNKLKLTRTELFKLTTKDIAIQTTKNVASGVIDVTITKPLLKNLLDSLKPYINSRIKEKIEKHEVKSKITPTSNKEHIMKLMTKILEGSLTEDATDCAKDITLGIMKSSKHSAVKNLAFVIDTVVDMVKISKYTNNFCESLNEKLNNNIKDGTDSDVISDLAEKLTEKVFSLLVKLVGKFSDRLIKDPLLNKAFDQSKKNNKPDETMEQSDKAKNIIVHDHETKNNHEYVNALNALGLKAGANSEEIKKAYRKYCILTHPDMKGGSNEAFHHIKNAYDILNRYNQSSNDAYTSNTNKPKPIEFPLILPPNAHMNDCGHRVLAKMLNVDRYDLTRKTGLYDTEKGSHLSDFITQFKTLGLDTRNIPFNANDLTGEKITKILDESKSSQAMLFINNPNNIDLGHILLAKFQDNKLVIFDYNKLENRQLSVDVFKSYTGNLLVPVDLDRNFININYSIVKNQEPHASLSKMESSGQKNERR